MKHLKTFELYQQSKKLCPWCDNHFTPKKDETCCCEECDKKWQKHQKSEKAEKPWDRFMKASKPWSIKPQLSYK